MQLLNTAVSYAGLLLEPYEQRQIFLQLFGKEALATSTPSDSVCGEHNCVRFSSSSVCTSEITQLDQMHHKFWMLIFLWVLFCLYY